MYIYVLYYYILICSYVKFTFDSLQLTLLQVIINLRVKYSLTLNVKISRDNESKCFSSTNLFKDLTVFNIYASMFTRNINVKYV